MAQKGQSKAKTLKKKKCFCNPLTVFYVLLFHFRNDLPKFTYLTMCLKESMRINPPVIFIQRETTKPLVFDKWEVPAGTLVNIPLYNILNNHTVWEDPLVRNSLKAPNTTIAEFGNTVDPDETANFYSAFLSLYFHDDTVELKVCF